MNVRLPNQQDAPGYCYGLPASKLLTPDWKTQGVVRECNATPLRNLRAAAHAVLVQRCKLGTQGLRSNDEGMARALAAATKVAASSSVVTLVILVAGGAAGVGSTAAVATAPTSVSATAGACVSVRILSSHVPMRALASIWLFIFLGCQLTLLRNRRCMFLCEFTCLQNADRYTCKHGDRLCFARVAGALPRTRWPSSQHLRFPSGIAQVQEGQP